MSWNWRYEQADGGAIAEVDGVSQPAHQNQSDAESWLGESWRALSDGGVAQVTLFDGDDAVYGPMSLDAE